MNTLNKTQNETVAWAKQLGFGPPRFEYSNDKEFISSLKNCINYLNFDIPRRQRINTELILNNQLNIENLWKSKKWTKQPEPST